MLLLPDVPDPTDNECTAVLETLFKGQTRSVILTLKPTYAQHFVPTSLGDKFPLLISEYFDEQCVGMSPSELVQHCTDKVFNEISVSASQAEQVEAETRRQAESKQWHRFRTGRVTASRMKAVCHTRMDKPSQSLVKAICYPHTSKLHTAGIRWGCDHEKTALSTYADQMRQSHENHQLTNSGLVMNPAYPFMGATQDSLVSCDCCGDGCVEVKCPCRKDFAEIDSRFCLEKVDEEGKLQLKRTHAYHYQVQTQLFVCNKDYCDFVVWTEGALHIERIEPDEEFWLSVELKAETFFKAAVLPEMVGKMFSRPQPATASISTITPAPQPR
ncbi:PREDICTED: uncharacterized protein LOC106815748 [Priapulus caudatus]|uniref:Uncharacterized protein LOC106815748 n=1 Tax=Priapulus caudatus TaxID=37621 RepID=A0ABM1EU70_PRICU|nr:PREDICTED: uncharacterized protein LOC106815748 [Priapulus caudatus]